MLHPTRWLGAWLVPGAALSVTLLAPQLATAQQNECPAVTYSNVSAHPVTGALQGTQIILTKGPKGCLALVRSGEEGPEATRSGPAIFKGDSVTFTLGEDGAGASSAGAKAGEKFEGVIQADTLRGRFGSATAMLLLPRTGGQPPHVHDASHSH